MESRSSVASSGCIIRYVFRQQYDRSVLANMAWRHAVLRLINHFGSDRCSDGTAARRRLWHGSAAEQLPKVLVPQHLLARRDTQKLLSCFSATVPANNPAI